jgi:putative flippase GtrA
MNLERLVNLLPALIRPSPRFLGFLLVGGVNTAFGYGMFVVCLWLGMHYAVAAAVATLLGVLFNFFSTGGLVFKNRDHRRLPWFIGVYVIIYCVNVAGLALLLLAGIPAWLGGLLLILPCAMLSYLLNSRLVFPS